MEMLSGPMTASSVDLAAAYAWPEGAWTRAMMLTTLDGAVAGADGLSGSISSATDRLIFSEVRRFCDAVLVGAGTIRAERYNPMKAKTEHQEARAVAGLKSAPVVVIVSRSLDLPWQDPLFHESAQQPIVLTGIHEPSSQALVLAQANADVQQIPDLEARTIIGAMHARGLSRIVCEGGPTLLTQMAAADLIDEYDITLAPILAGNGHGIVHGSLGEITRLHLAQAITDQGFVFTKYVRVPD
jgi:riboflavin biosynthesis pyrimidine reductase